MATCGICQTEFESKNRFCSQKCRNTYISCSTAEKRNASNREVAAKKREERAIQKSILEAQREPSPCETCDAVDKHTYSSKRFCSEKCARKFSAKQNREETNRKIRETFKRTRKPSPIHTLRCNRCNKAFESKKSSQKFCSKRCANRTRGNVSGLSRKYKLLTAFRFSLNQFPDEFDFSLVEKHGWYKAANRGNNLDGVSRDHLLAVMDGFKQRINPLLLAHPANCRLLVHSENVSKGCKSELTIETLLERILKWNAKYGSFYTTSQKTILTDEEIEELFLHGTV